MTFWGFPCTISKGLSNFLKPPSALTGDGYSFLVYNWITDDKIDLKLAYDSPASDISVSILLRSRRLAGSRSATLLKDKNARMPYEKRIRSRPLCRLPEPMAHTRLLRCGSSLPKKNLSVRPPWKYRPFRHRPRTPLSPGAVVSKIAALTYPERVLKAR